VIVVIGVLAAITIVSYTGVSSKAIAASLQTDLSNSSKKLKMYYAEYGTYPQTLDGSNCPQTPNADSKYCLKPTSGTAIYYCTSAPYSKFALGARSSNGTGYIVTDSTAPQAGSGYVPIFCNDGKITQNSSTRTHTFDTNCTSTVPCSITASASGTVTVTVLAAGGGGGEGSSYNCLGGPGGEDGLSGGNSYFVLGGVSYITYGGTGGTGGSDCGDWGTNGTNGGTNSPVGLVATIGGALNGGARGDGWDGPEGGGAGGSGGKLSGSKVINAGEVLTIAIGKGGAGGGNGGAGLDGSLSISYSY